MNILYFIKICWIKLIEIIQRYIVNSYWLTKWGQNVWKKDKKIHDDITGCIHLICVKLGTIMRDLLHLIMFNAQNHYKKIGVKRNLSK